MKTKYMHFRLIRALSALAVAACQTPQVIWATQFNLVNTTTSLQFAATCVVVLTLQSLSPAAYFHYTGGLVDNYQQLPDPASPSAGLLLQHGGLANEYDAIDPDKPFLETFDRLACCIIDARLQVEIQPQQFPNSDDDTIQFSFTNSSGVQSTTYWQTHIGNPSSPATLFGQSWNSGNFVTSQSLTFNLGSLPSPQLGTSTNLLPMMNTVKYLDIVIEDNTQVDYMNLWIQTQLDGDVNGDGCVDANDLNLFAQHFGNPVPTGLGDPNGDGLYDINDLGLIQASFGKCCIPEPGSLALMGIGIAGLLGLGRHRRVSVSQSVLSRANMVRTAIVIVAGLATCSPAMANRTFNFAKIADTATIIPSGPGGPFTDLFPPAVSGGKVAFRGDGATSFGSADWSGIITNLPGPLTRVASGLSSAGNAIIYDPSISGGDIAYHQTAPYGTGASVINVWNAGTTTPIAGKTTLAPPGGSGSFDILERPSVNNGKVAFRGWASPPALGGIFSTASGSLANNIRGGLTPVPPLGIDTFNFASEPDYDGSLIAFRGQSSSGVEGIYRAVPTPFGAITRFVDSTMLVPGTITTFSLFSDRPSFDGADVSFSSFYAGGNGIFRTVGSSIVTVADWSTPIPGGTGNFNLLFQDTAIDQDFVAFIGRGSSNQKGLYLHDALTSQLCEVISVGAPLDNKIVRDIAIGREALDANKLGFWVRFTDNSEGIYLTMVPEPCSGMMLLGISTCVAIAHRSRRRDDEVQ